MEPQTIISIAGAVVLGLAVLGVLVLVIGSISASIEQSKHNRERELFKQKEMREIIDSHHRRNRQLDLMAASNRNNKGLRQ